MSGGQTLCCERVARERMTALWVWQVRHLNVHSAVTGPHGRRSFGKTAPMTDPAQPLQSASIAST